MSEQLEVLFPAGKDVTVSGETITITPFKVGQLPKVFKAVEPIAGHIAASFAGAENPTSALMSLLARGGENVLDLVAIGARKDRAWVDNLEPDELIPLFGAVFEVNVSFFVQKVLPQLKTEMDSFKVPTGLTSS